MTGGATFRAGVEGDADPGFRLEIGSRSDSGRARN